MDRKILQIDDRCQAKNPNCGSNVNLKGPNSNVMMSGCVDDNPDDARRETIRGHTEVYRKELTLVQAARIMGVSERQSYRIKAHVTKHGTKEVCMETEADPAR
jgi:hypothetical protein